MIPRAILGLILTVWPAAAPLRTVVARRTIPSLILEACRREGLDPLFALGIAYRESRFQPRRISRAGAIGVMQLMPLTIRVFGVLDPFNARQNVDAGVAYLAQLVERYGSTSMADCVYSVGLEACR